MSRRVLAAALPAEDLATRERLLQSAARLFAERGFKKVTVRDISTDAGANVAAVNYHFGDKLGLYRAIVEQALVVMEETNRQAIDAGAGLSPEDQLGLFVERFVQRLLTPRPDTLVHQMMLHELADPTEMLDVILRRVMRPRLSYLCKVIGQLMGRPPADTDVIHCAASVQAQCLMCKQLPTMQRAGADLPAPDPATLAAHITAFSLAGIRGRATPSANAPITLTNGHRPIGIDH